MRRWLGLLCFLSSAPAGAQTYRAVGISGVEPDRTAIFTVRGPGVGTPLVAFQERARQTVEARMNAEVVSMDETLARGGPAFQKKLAACQGEPKCFSELLGSTLDARYLVVITASLLGDVRLLGVRLVDLSEKKVLGEAIDEVAGAQTFLDVIPDRIRASVPADRWDPFGNLEIKVNEPGAQITVNGHIVGLSPLEGGTSLLPGEYRVSVSKKGFEPTPEQTLKVERGGQGALNFELKALPGAEKGSSVWLWVGLGAAVVAGGAAAAYFGLSGGSEVPPTFCSASSPGQCP